MKTSKKAHSTRKHGLSRLERLLAASISHELAIKSLREQLCTQSLRIAVLERLKRCDICDSVLDRVTREIR